MFISAPADKGKDGKYYESVVLPRDLTDTLQKIAIEKYKK